MAKPLTSWLVPSFSQHNLRPVVSGCCLHFSVTKFQDKFTSLQQANSLSSWEKFQICCTDMYLIRFLPNFAVFCVFLWISRLCDRAKYEKPRLTMSCIIYKLATKNLHLATIFLQLVAKRRPEDFFNFEPCLVWTLHYPKWLKASLVTQPETHITHTLGGRVLMSMGIPNLGKVYVERENQFTITTHKTAINRPMDHTGET